MIRIVDILRNAGENIPPEEQGNKGVEVARLVKKADSGPEETKKFCEDALNALKAIFTKVQPDEEALEKGKLLIAGIEKLIDQPLLRKNESLTAILKQQPNENNAYVHALRILINSINLGVDASYSRNHLIELGAASLLLDKELSGLPGAKILKGVLGSRFKLTEDKSRSIIELAEIYENIDRG